MSVHSYPLLLSLYKGEGRILIVPLIDHVAGYSIDADWFLNVTDVDDAIEIGGSVISAVDYIRNSPLSSLTPKEREDNAAWKKNTKYKSKVTFWKNNHYVRIKITEDNQYIIHSMKKSEKRQGAYAEIIEEVVLSSDANADEIGKAVIFTFHRAEMFYKKHTTKNKQIQKKIALLDGSKLTVKLPWDKEFVDFQDGGSAEVYQCYKNLSDAGDILADIFLGIAPELDCDLKEENILDSWQSIYGKLTFSEIKNVSNGVFHVRAEMKNENVHKISYFVQTAEDLLLECGLQIYVPNELERSAEQLVNWFEQFVLSCKITQTR